VYRLHGVAGCRLSASFICMPAGCLSSTCVSSLGGNFISPFGVALSGNGNLFLVDYLSGLVKQLNFISPPSLGFASTAVGSTSSDSPKSVTVTNDGNAALTIEVPSTGMNPKLSAGFTFSNSSTCPQVTSSSSAAALAAGASCVAAVSFSPTVPGSISGSMVITDDSLNAAGPAYTTQSISLSGPATAPPVTATTVIPSTSLTRNRATSAFIPVTATGGSGTLTYAVLPALPTGLSFSATTGTVSGTATVVSAATTYTVTVSSPNVASGTATFNLTVNPAVGAATAVASTSLALNSAATAFIPVTGSGGTSPLAYSVSPSLPAGLSFSSSTGAVSGTPTASRAAATYTVTVTDSNGATASATFSLTVSGPTATATVLTSSNHAPAFGTSVVLTATVTPASTDEPPGTINFYAGTTLLGSSTLNASGVATLSTTFPQGSATITAVYSGSARFAGSTSNALPVSALAGTSITLSATPTTQLFNSPIVLSAQVASATSGILTGTITFLDGTTAIANSPVAMNGQASYSVSSLEQGSHTLTASYSGDGNFQPSTSTGTGIAITVGNIDLNLGNDQNQTVVPGGVASYTFPLSPEVTPTFLYDVKLTATGLPPGATYTFSPATIPAGSASLPVTLTVQTAKTTGSLSPPASRGKSNSLRGLTAIALGAILPLIGFRRMRYRLTAIPRTLALALFTAVAVCATLELSGCGAGGFFGHTATTGTYTIIVTASSADLVRTSTVQLTIQ